MGSRILRHSWFDSGYTLMLQFTDLPEILTRLLSFGRETHVPCVGPASPPGSEHSGPSWASQGSDWPPLRGHIIHLVLRRKSPCEVAESVIGRPQNTISWTGSEAEYRDAACVGFLRNSTVILWTFTSERSTERGPLVSPTIFVLTMETRECPNAQVQPEHLTAATGHPFEDVTASYHPLGIAGKVAGKSSNTQWAFRQLWKQVRNLTSATSAVCS